MKNRSKFLKLVSACLSTTLSAVGAVNAMKHTKQLSVDAKESVSGRSNISFTKYKDLDLITECDSGVNYKARNYKKFDEATEKLKKYKPIALYNYVDESCNFLIGLTKDRNYFIPLDEKEVDYKKTRCICAKIANNVNIINERLNLEKENKLERDLSSPKGVILSFNSKSKSPKIKAVAKDIPGNFKDAAIAEFTNKESNLNNNNFNSDDNIEENRLIVRPLNNVNYYYNKKLGTKYDNLFTNIKIGDYEFQARRRIQACACPEYEVFKNGRPLLEDILNSQSLGGKIPKVTLQIFDNTSAFNMMGMMNFVTYSGVSSAPIIAVGTEVLNSPLMNDIQLQFAVRKYLLSSRRALHCFNGMYISLEDFKSYFNQDNAVGFQHLYDALEEAERFFEPFAKEFGARIVSERACDQVIPNLTFFQSNNNNNVPVNDLGHLLGAPQEHDDANNANNALVVGMAPRFNNVLNNSANPNLNANEVYKLVKELAKNVEGFKLFRPISFSPSVVSNEVIERLNISKNNLNRNLLGNKEGK